MMVAGPSGTERAILVQTWFDTGSDFGVNRHGVNWYQRVGGGRPGNALRISSVLPESMATQMRNAIVADPEQLRAYMRAAAFGANDGSGVITPDRWAHNDANLRALRPPYEDLPADWKVHILDAPAEMSLSHRPDNPRTPVMEHDPPGATPGMAVPYSHSIAGEIRTPQQYISGAPASRPTEATEAGPVIEGAGASVARPPRRVMADGTTHPADTAALTLGTPLALTGADGRPTIQLRQPTAATQTKQLTRPRA